MATGLALIPVARASDLEAQARQRNQELQAQPVIQGLASHVRSRWTLAKDAKDDIEERMLQCLRQRNGQYDPDKLADIFGLQPRRQRRYRQTSQIESHSACFRKAIGH